MFSTAPNRRPGAGRKCNEIRRLCQVEVAKRIPMLCEFADDEELCVRDRLLAFRELSRIGVPQQHEPIPDEEQTDDPNRIDYDAMSNDELRTVREAKRIMSRHERKRA